MPDNCPVRGAREEACQKHTTTRSILTSGSSPWSSWTFPRSPPKLPRSGSTRPCAGLTEDEFFFVLQGSFVIEYEKKRILLKPHQGFTVPRGVLHKTSVTEPTVILMMEAVTVKPTGD